MITVLKCRLMTDDEGLSVDLKEAIENALRDVAANDPEGAAHAHVLLEWQANVHPRSYMQNFVQNAGPQKIAIPTPTPARKPRRK